MPSIGEILELEIESLAYRGQGLARHEGLVTFVAGVLPGERVRVRWTRIHRNYAEAELLEILVPAPGRIVPCCRLPNGVRIPGCVYDHLAYPAEVAAKQRQLEGFLRRLPGAAGLRLLPPVPSPRDLHYRNKIVLHAHRGTRERAPLLGYVGDDNRTIVDVPACPLARVEINEALQAFRVSEAFRQLRDRDRVTFRWTAADGVVAWRNENPPSGQPPLTEQAPFGPVRVPAGGFYQVNPEVAPVLVQQVVDWFAGGGGFSRGATPDLLDLYCGVGVFAIACALAGARRVSGIEAGRDAVAAATQNAQQHRVHASFLCRLMQEAARTLFDGMDLANVIVIVDPPRQGLEPPVVQALALGRPPRIFYVSCDPATLARDLQVLLAAGYRMQEARLFDMFPRTAHFETAVWLERTGSGSIGR
jgi:tRNA/tmRNA/rRNA uracil-C5-methylase (TrmA/RlmC/RlmD family)